MLRYLTKANTLSFRVLRNFSKLYTKEHEWIQLDNDVATIGITDYAQNELGEIVHCELPKVGDRFKEGDTLGALESVKTAADIYSPVEGSVSEVNDKLTKTPKLINTHPISQGWYAKLKVDTEKTKPHLEKLMSEEAYNQYLQDLKK